MQEPKFLLAADTSISETNGPFSASSNQNIPIISSNYQPSTRASYPTTRRSPSAFTNFPSEEEPGIWLNASERDTFNLIYFIDSEALTPFGPLDWTRDNGIGHYRWKERSRSATLPAIHIRPNVTGADVTFRVNLTKLITIYAHVPMHSWEFGTCDSRSIRAALQKGYFALLRGDPRSVIVRPAMYPIPAVSTDEAPASPSVPEHEINCRSKGRAARAGKADTNPSSNHGSSQASQPNSLEAFSAGRYIRQIPTPSSTSEMEPMSPASTGQGSFHPSGSVKPLVIVRRNGSSVEVRTVKETEKSRIHSIGDVDQSVVIESSGMATPSHLLASITPRDHNIASSSRVSLGMAPPYDVTTESTVKTRQSVHEEAVVTFVDHGILGGVIVATLEIKSTIVETTGHYRRKAAGFLNLLEQKLDRVVTSSAESLKSPQQISFPRWFWPLMLRYFCIIMAYALCIIITRPPAWHFNLMTVSWM